MLNTDTRYSIRFFSTRFLMLVLAILFLFPFYWMVAISFRSQQSILQVPPQLIDTVLTLDNYQRLLRAPHVLVWVFNSFFVSIATVLLVCITSALAGYGFAKKQFPGKQVIFWTMIGAMALPKQVLLVPLFSLMNSFGFTDTYQGLIMPAVGWPFGVFLVKQFAQTIPSELMDAAEIDGCGELTTFIRVIAPLIMPGVGALAIFTFMSSWNDYFWQLIVIQSNQMKTLPLGVAGLQAEFLTDYGLQMAGSVAASIPMIIVFIAFQRYFKMGLTIGAVKG